MLTLTRTRYPQRGKLQGFYSDHAASQRQLGKIYPALCGVVALTLLRPSGPHRRLSQLLLMLHQLPLRLKSPRLLPTHQRKNRGTRILALILGTMVVLVACDGFTHDDRALEKGGRASSKQLFKKTFRNLLALFRLLQRIGLYFRFAVSFADFFARMVWPLFIALPKTHEALGLLTRRRKLKS